MFWIRDLHFGVMMCNFWMRVHVFSNVMFYCFNQHIGYFDGYVKFLGEYVKCVWKVCQVCLGLC